MDGSSAYSFLSIAWRGADLPMCAGSARHVRSSESSKTDSLRRPRVSGAVVLSVLSPKSHELEKSE